MVVKDIVSFSSSYTDKTLQGLWVVGFGGGSMDLGATTSTGGDGHSAMAIVKALDNDRTGGNHVCPAMLYSLVLIIIKNS